jgi:hypothetical protein
MADPQDEFRHEPGEEQLWNESWYFDVAAPDGSWGMYARLGLYPNLKVAWYWAVIVREGEPMLLVRDHELDIPKGESLEVRGSGLWADTSCLEPHQRWQLSFEGDAVALDDPKDAYGDERGERVPIAFEFEWEGCAPVFVYPGVSRYEQSCMVHGEVLIGSSDTKLGFDTPVPGQRDHSWGVRDWWAFPWVWTAGALEDGTRFHASRPEVPMKYEPSYRVDPDGSFHPAFEFEVGISYGEDGLPSDTTMRVAGLDVVATPLLPGGVLMEAPDGRNGRLHRAVCRFTAPDGRIGVGWTEWNLPPPR